MICHKKTFTNGYLFERLKMVCLLFVMSSMPYKQLGLSIQRNIRKIAASQWKKHFIGQQVFTCNRPFATNNHMVQNLPCRRASSLVFPQWDIKTKASHAWLVEVSLFWSPSAGIIMSLLSSMADFLPCDRLLQKAYSQLMLVLHFHWVKSRTFSKNFLRGCF